MKKKTRTIIVNHTAYIWWYDLSVRLNFSPKNDKTAMITVEFFPINPEKYDKNFPKPYYEYFPEFIIIKKFQTTECIKIISPKMANILLSYFKMDSFIARKTVNYNGYHLLSEIGYQIIDVKNGLCL